MVQYKKVSHVPSSIGLNLSANQATVFIMANAGANLTTGGSASIARESLSNREQENTIGSKIFRSTLTISLTPGMTPGAVEFAICKVERAGTVPTSDGTLLPTAVDITTQGLQQAIRTHQPGRVIHYQKVAIANEQPRVVTVRIPWSKYKMQTVRTGDFYLCMLYNRLSQCRYNECI